MLGIVATLKVKRGQEAAFEAVATELVAKVRANEPGCTLYALHRPQEAATEGPSTYVFMERYVDQAAVEAHRATDYFKALGRKMGEYMEGRPDVMRLQEVQ
jgi:quinol monooxygenase YgiN